MLQRIWIDLLLLSLMVGPLTADVGAHEANISGENHEVIDEEPNGVIDFSQAEPQKDGSLCITKTKFIEKMEKTPVKECWTQNVTQCHDTYVTEFKPNQEQECEENFWKACKITFQEVGYNYTLKTCMKPLIKRCDEPKPQTGYGAPPVEPKIVCKTWFESVCNTTFSQGQGSQLSREEQEPKVNTWCEKVPKKICAPDFCEMVPGEEVCEDKTLQSTVLKPEEVCDLQPTKQCRLVTNLVPHLEAKSVCKEIPKEVCHLKLDNPQFVKKPITMRWCTRPKQADQPSYLPQPPPSQYGIPVSQSPQQPQHSRNYPSQPANFPQAAQPVRPLTYPKPLAV